MPANVNLYVFPFRDPVQLRIYSVLRSFLDDFEFKKESWKEFHSGSLRIKAVILEPRSIIARYLSSSFTYLIVSRLTNNIIISHSFFISCYASYYNDTISIALNIGPNEDLTVVPVFHNTDWETVKSNRLDWPLQKVSSQNNLFMLFKWESSSAEP